MENDWVLIQRYFLKDYDPVDTFLAKYLNDAELVDVFVTDLKTLTNQVIRFVGAFQDSPGIKRYQEAWGREFPLNELKCLKGLRGTSECKRTKEFSSEVPVDSQFAKAIQILRSLVATKSVNPDPGLSLDIIDAICQEANLMLPPQVVEWLTCCNGISTNMAHGSLYGLAEAINYDEHVSHWRARGWTPIGDDGCGSYYLVIKHETPEGTLYPVVFADHEDSDTMVLDRITYLVASDLPHFLEVIFLNQEHDDKYRDSDEEVDFWWPFEKDRVLEYDPDMDKIEITKPWET
jgi:hypothetical protein